MRRVFARGSIKNANLALMDGGVVCAAGWSSDIARRRVSSVCWRLDLSLAYGKFDIKERVADTS
jgi:hypothetical protein